MAENANGISEHYQQLFEMTFIWKTEMLLHKLCGIEFVSSLSKPSETSASYMGHKTDKIMNMQPD